LASNVTGKVARSL